MSETGNAARQDGPRSLPGIVGRGAQLLPVWPLALATERLTRRVAAGHPEMFRRLGPYSACAYLIDPTDLPVSFLLRPDPARPRLTVQRRPVSWDCRIAGPLLALIGMVQGDFDGDALFFRRDITVEGDTEAALALRNAIDDAELDLFGEVEEMLGPVLGQPLRLIRRNFLSQTREGQS